MDQCSHAVRDPSQTVLSVGTDRFYLQHPSQNRCQSCHGDEDEPKEETCAGTGWDTHSIPCPSIMQHFSDERDGLTQGFGDDEQLPLRPPEVRFDQVLHAHRSQAVDQRRNGAEDKTVSSASPRVGLPVSVGFKPQGTAVHSSEEKPGKTRVDCQDVHDQVRHQLSKRSVH